MYAAGSLSLYATEIAMDSSAKKSPICGRGMALYYRKKPYFAHPRLWYATSYEPDIVLQPAELELFGGSFLEIRQS